jgi:OmpA-OmpF porin, OOP family
MTRLIFRKMVALPALLLISSLMPLASSSAADSVKVQGFIKSRNGDTMTLKTSDSPSVTVLLTDGTQVGQVEGLLKARRKEMSMAALIPGLAVKVEGTYNDQNQLVAQKVSFKGDDLRRAESIQAGMHETQVQTKENQAGLEKQQGQLTEQQQKVAENKAAINAATARFGQLDDYYIRDEVTVYFANGKADVAPKYDSQLLALGEKAKGIDGYVIEVKGFASAVGSAELNQRLSDDRAEAVSQILIQQARIPLTRMLAPGAMGESEQVGNDKTEQGQAENRRVVVRVLQNKAVAGE